MISSKPLSQIVLAEKTDKLKAKLCYLDSQLGDRVGEDMLELWQVHIHQLNLTANKIARLYNVDLKKY